MTRATLLVPFALLAGWGLVGCHKTRADYRDNIADAVCSQMKKCGAIGGANAQFADTDDCVTQVRSTYNDLWPADQCSDGRIDAKRFDECKRRAVAKACGGNILDTISFRLECGADEVCVAPSKGAHQQKNQGQQHPRGR